MGADLKKELASVVHNPENDGRMRKLFKHVDKDKSGFLDKEEFSMFGTLLLQVDLEDANKELKSKVNVKRGFGSFSISFDSDTFNQIKALTKGEEHYKDKQAIIDFVDDLWREAGKGDDERMSFDEFKKFIKQHAEKDFAERLELDKIQGTSSSTHTQEEEIFPGWMESEGESVVCTDADSVTQCVSQHKKYCLDPSLEELNLRGSSNEVIRSISHLLKSNTTLKGLFLKGSPLNQELNYQALTLGLEANTTLKKLDLSACQLNGQAMATLKKALKSHPSLLSLSLVGNWENGDAVAKEVGEILKTNENLQYLALWGCHITCDGAQAIALGLKSNRSLISIELWSMLSS
eukprot:TRINITY_DN2167_c0_g1_i15.p1 TRINITY_DN2167_c0_g1~~TRINITY_DN2167_c0_g1_i15.p1  ORF type:complete len:349 (+),score=63.58 TRINITY_DN2167_c0_g1_i15:242-1288(+)